MKMKMKIEDERDVGCGVWCSKVRIGRSVDNGHGAIGISVSETFFHSPFLSFKSSMLGVSTFSPMN